MSTASIQSVSSSHDGFRYGLLVNAVALAAALVAVVALMGWLSGKLILAQGMSGRAAMVPSTCVTVLGCAAMLWRRGPRGERSLPAALSIAILAGTFLLIAVEISLFYTHKTSLEQLIFPGFETSESLKMANATALCGLIFCAGKAVMLFGNDDFAASGKWFALAGANIAAVSLIAHLFNAQALYEVSLFEATSVLTSVAFFLLFVGLGAIQPTALWPQTLLGNSQTSRRMRRFIVPATITPIILGLIVLSFAEQSTLPEQFRLSVVATVMSALILFGLFLLTARENMAEDVRSALIEELEQLVGDRDVLLAEVYHRVKNNLAQINALLRIQADMSSSPEVKSALGWATGRVDAIATVQNLLMSSPTLDHLSIKEFLEKLSENAMLAMGADLNHIVLKSDIDDMKVDISTATTIGLLVNELFSNIAKHAFQGEALSKGTPGIINLNFERGDEEHTLTVRDNGRGLPDDKKSLPTSGSGSVIIAALVQQLNGRYEYTSQDGLETCISFRA